MGGSGLCGVGSVLKICSVNKVKYGTSYGAEKDPKVFRSDGAKSEKVVRSQGA